LDFDIYLSSNTGLSSWLRGEKIHLTQEEVDKFIDENELSAGNIYTKRKLDDFVSFLESKYSESGYYNVSIEKIVDQDVQNRVGIDLIVTQGKRATIETFTINGKKCKNYLHPNNKHVFKQINKILFNKNFNSIHGDPTLSNILIKKNL
jgi:hypothetical protein